MIGSYPNATPSVGLAARAERKLGRDLDALADCLDTLAREGEGEWEIVWDGVAELRRSDPRAAAGIESILRELNEEYPKVHVTLINR